MKNTDTMPEYFLVIEDDDGLRELMIMILNKSGIEARGVSTGKAAIEIIQTDPPLAMLLDQKLPDMTGRDIVTSLAGQGIKVAFIMMTGKGDERLAVEMMKLGASDYLVKDMDFLEVLPVAVERLLHAVRTEQALQRAESENRQHLEMLRKYELIISTVHDPMSIVDRNYVYQTVNQAYLDLFNKTRQEIEGNSVSKLTGDQAFNERAKPYLDRCFQGETVQYQHWLTLPDGDRKCFDTRYEPIFSEDGSVEGLVGCSRDITVIKETEKSLHESEKYNRSILDAIPDIIIRTNRAGKYLDIITSSEEKLYQPREALMGKNVSDVFPKTQALRFMESVHKTLDEKTLQVVEYDLSIASKNYWFEARIVPLGKEEVIALICDITDLKLAQEELQTNEKRFQQMLALVPDMISIHDPDMNILYSNWKGFAEVPAEKRILNTKCYKTYRGYDRICPDCKAHTVLETKKPFECEVELPTGIWVDLRVLPLLNDKGEVEFFLEWVRDITQQKKSEEERIEMERQLLHTQKLESLGVLAGGIAHDFNNLLMAMIGNLEMALHEISPVSSARNRVEQAMKASQRAADLTNQMLAYSGKGHFIVRDIDINELINENMHIFRSSISRNVGFQQNLDPNLPFISADPAQIQQIIMNLITNASEAIGDNSGNIMLTTGMTDCDDAYFDDSLLNEKPCAGKYVFLEVTDTGCGMDKQTMEKMFDPFFTTKFTGRGLGMAAVIGIVRGHNGAIFVDSEPGRGTTIRVLFPASKEKPKVETEKKQTHRTEAPRQEPSSKTVLIVDDEEFVLDMCNEMVMRFGYKTLTAENGKQAVEIYQENSDRIDCVILDLSMPLMGGYETFMALKQINPDVKVILSSGYDREKATKKFDGERLSGFIQKPYQMAALKEELAKC